MTTSSQFTGGPNGERCRVDLAEVGDCSSTCRRCGQPMSDGQAVYHIVHGTWLRNKVRDLHNAYLVHTACPLPHPQDAPAAVEQVNSLSSGYPVGVPGGEGEPL